MDDGKGYKSNPNAVDHKAKAYIAPKKPLVPSNSSTNVKGFYFLFSRDVLNSHYFYKQRTAPLTEFPFRRGRSAMEWKPTRSGAGLRSAPGAGRQSSLLSWWEQQGRPGTSPASPATSVTRGWTAASSVRGRERSTASLATGKTLVPRASALALEPVPWLPTDRNHTSFVNYAFLSPSNFWDL